MIVGYYTAMLAASLTLTLLYVFIYHKHLDVHVTLIFALTPVANLGYALLCRARNLDEALMAVRITYIGGCYLPVFVMLAVFGLCRIRVNRWLRVGLVGVATAMVLAVQTIGRRPLFYAAASMERFGGATVLRKQYGPMHTAFQAMLLACLLTAMAAMVYTYINDRQVSRKTIDLMFLPGLVSFAAFFGGRYILPSVDLMPASYVLVQLTYLIIVYRISLYDIADTAVDTLIETGATGFVSIDFKFNYLGSNETARAVFPELSALTVDRPISRNAWMRDNAMEWITAFRDDESMNTRTFERNDKSYVINISYLFDGRRRRGYQFFIIDDTADQQYIKLIDSYNTDLQREVARKTAHIVEMHDRLILGMATMVESRDNSTGGHIRRTSECVRMLIAEMKRDPANDLSDDFCRNIIKAAPMHDLGKIAVDDVILRKPGRFTPEEFEKMKAHAAEGARIVHEILEGTEDEDFRRIAENVAHYHHERWDGSGYPAGLKGDEIPLEARVMAIADVYDALVSKRVYKERMSFEQAHAIIMEGMGKHFDKRLLPYYLGAKPLLEAYYASID